MWPAEKLKPSSRALNNVITISNSINHAAANSVSQSPSCFQHKKQQQLTHTHFGQHTFAEVAKNRLRGAPPPHFAGLPGCTRTSHGRPRQPNRAAAPASSAALPVGRLAAACHTFPAGCCRVVSVRLVFCFPDSNVFCFVIITIM